MIELSGAGLYCARGGFHIDPWDPVERAVITHAHSDHARPGSHSLLNGARRRRPAAKARRRRGGDPELRLPANALLWGMSRFRFIPLATCWARRRFASSAVARSGLFRETTNSPAIALANLSNRSDVTPSSRNPPSPCPSSDGLLKGNLPKQSMHGGSRIAKPDLPASYLRTHSARRSAFSRC